MFGWLGKLFTRRLSKQEIIQETANSYTINSRAISTLEDGSEMSCLYTDKNGNHCAAGRCMTDKGLKRLGDIEIGICSIKDELGVELDSILKPQYRGHSIKFWRDIQNFHDHVVNWDESGLSKKGKEEYNKLMNMYAE